MVRPNHELPNIVLGGVRDYADREGLDPEDAHAQLLMIAFEEVGLIEGVQKDLGMDLDNNSKSDS